MLIFQRLIGVSSYVLLLMIFLMLLYMNFNLKYILFSYTLLLSIMAFFYVPYESADLYRIYEMMRTYSFHSFSSILPMILGSSTPGAVFIYWIIGKTGVLEILPFITSFIFYLNVFIITYKSCLKFDLNKNYCILVVFFIMSFGQYLQVISTIRSMLAFSIIANVVFNYYIEHKKLIKCGWKLLIAMSLHNVGVIAVVVFLLVNAFFRTENGNYRILKRTFSFIFLMAFLFFMRDLFDDSLNVFFNYFTSNSYSYFWEYLLTSLHLILIILFLFVYKNLIKRKVSINNLNKFIITMICIIIVFFSEYSTFQRFSVLISICFIPILCFILNYIQNNKSKSNKLYIKILFYTSFVILMIACTRGNLSALKFWS